MSARRRQWLVLGCSALALMIGTIALGHLGTCQPSPMTTTAAPVDQPLVQRTVDVPNASLDSQPSTEITIAAVGVEQISSADSLRDFPHPLTPEHERLFAINRVLQQARQAVDSRDAPRLRALLAQHRELEPTDPLRQRLGYERIADCLESPGAASRQAALHFWQTETASSVRRLVRRRCLEGP